MKKILVAVDLSAATIQVCNAARDLAHSLKARLMILHVVPPAPLVMEYYAMNALQLERLPRAAQKRAAEKLRALGHWFAKSCPETKVIQHTGDPVSTILHTARVKRPDYIVLGSHGHTSAFELLMGSVAHGIVRRSSVPVLLVPIRKRSTTPKRRVLPGAEALAIWR